MLADLKAAAGRAFCELFLACWWVGVPALERVDRATGPWFDPLIGWAQGRGPTTFPLRATPFVRWYDLWVGAYVDRSARAVYVCPIPCVGVKVEWGEPAPPPARCAYCRCEVDDAEFFGNYDPAFGHCCDGCLYQRREEERELRDDYDDQGDDDCGSAPVVGPGPDGGDDGIPF